MSLHVISLSLLSNRSLENHLMARIYPPQGNHEHSCLWTGAGQTCHPRIPSYQHQHQPPATSTGLVMTRPGLGLGVTQFNVCDAELLN